MTEPAADPGPASGMRNYLVTSGISRLGGRYSYLVTEMSRQSIDLELTLAALEVRELEARRRVVPMNDGQLAKALEMALRMKRERLQRLRSQHAAQIPTR